MNQQPLFAPAQPDTVQVALETLRCDPAGFSMVTEGWLLNNKHVWLAFYNATERLRRARKGIVGAKCVYEHLRYMTTVSDSGSTFKLDSSYVSGLSRLYNAVVGYEFFETRKAA